MINLFLFFAIKENKLVDDICKVILTKYLELYVESFSYTIRNMILRIHNYGNINQINLSNKDINGQLRSIIFSSIYSLDSLQKQENKLLNI